MAKRFPRVAGTSPYVQTQCLQPETRGNRSAKTHRDSQTIVSKLIVQRTWYIALDRVRPRPAMGDESRRTRVEDTAATLFCQALRVVLHSQRRMTREGSEDQRRSAYDHGLKHVDHVRNNEC
jgi:hypothetical protein